MNKREQADRRTAIYITIRQQSNAGDFVRIAAILPLT